MSEGTKGAGAGCVRRRPARLVFEVGDGLMAAQRLVHRLHSELSGQGAGRQATNEILRTSSSVSTCNHI